MDYVIDIYHDKTIIFGNQIVNKNLDGKMNICEHYEYDCKDDENTLYIGDECMREGKAKWTWKYDRFFDFE